MQSSRITQNLWWLKPPKPHSILLSHESIIFPNKYPQQPIRACPSNSLSSHWLISKKWAELDFELQSLQGFFSPFVSEIFTCGFDFYLVLIFKKIKPKVRNSFFQARHQRLIDHNQHFTSLLIMILIMFMI